MNMETVFAKLAEQIGTDKLVRNAPMKEYTSFKAGGACDLLVLPTCWEDAAAAVCQCANEGIPYMIVGNGSDLLVRDGGYRGVMIALREGLSEITVDPSGAVTAEAGALLSVLAKRCAEQSLTGLEFAGGIPGSVGGAVFMNAGAYGGEMKDVLVSVRAMKQNGEIHEIAGPDLKLGYRHSLFQETGEIVVSATLRLTPGNRDKIEETSRDLAKKRNSKQPLQYPSAGSFFKRPEGHFAGKLIQDAGLSGLKLGGARVSPLHAGFIINEGGATATDILRLMEVIQNTVYDQFGVRLEPEVRIVGES